MYWNNVDLEIVVMQQKVFSFLGLKLQQLERTGQKHGEFLNEQLKTARLNDVLIFVDIDCVVMNAEVVYKAANFAKKGGIWGCSQVANHLEDSFHAYAGPMFHAISKKTWLKMGSPSYSADKYNDIGQNITRQAQLKNINIYLARPLYSLIPKWPHGKDYLFGIGTFYECGVFHLFESRKGVFNKLFKIVGDSIISRKDINYLELTNIARKIEMKVTAFNLCKKILKIPFRVWEAFYRYIRN
ncbi:hypothetical protein MCEET85_00865 [Candidatus Methylopumilus planktonicus]